MFDVDSNYVRYRLSLEKKSSFEPVKIAHNLSFDMIARLEENRESLPGVGYTVENQRSYKMQSSLAHLLGYTREISPAQLKKLGEYYRPGDIVGYGGIEQYYEEELRGNKGYLFHTVDARGKVVESFDHGQSDLPATEGADLVLSIDDKFQKYCEDIMRHKQGAIVAMDPTNGEILAFVSSPSYDLRQLTGKIDPEVWQALNADKNKPFYNRASMAAYPPGSTFKMMLAAAALQEGVIDEHTTVNCPGSFTLVGVTFKCHGAHGNISVERAIEYSCNVFFYKLIFKLGFKLWSQYGDMFHFGRRTGIDITQENPGVLPSEEYYNKRYGRNWNKGFLVSLGIGQGELNTTPLQMASYTSTIANGGTYFRPHVVRSIVDRAAGGRHDLPVNSERLPISPSVWNIIQQGMFRVVNGGGTGSSARLAGITVAGKTGTAQNPHGRDHAWFVGYAPFRDPKIAIAVIVENGGFGGAAAAPIASAAIAYWLRSGTPDTQADSTAAARAAKKADSNPGSMAD
jgi:penicillin-binding protein 2